MKTLKTFCAAAILSLALAIPASAGDIQTPTFTSPAPGDTYTAAFAEILVAVLSLI